MVKKRRTPPGQGGDGAAVCRENLQQNEEQGREKQENSAEVSGSSETDKETDGGVPQDCGSVEEGTAAKAKPPRHTWSIGDNDDAG